MRVSHRFTTGSARFDENNLVSHAGLVALLGVAGADPATGDPVWVPGTVRAENPVTISEQHVPGSRPRQYRPDESQHDRALWPSDSST